MAAHRPTQRNKTPPLDRLIAELASRQHGVVSNGQLLELGASRSAIYRRAGAGLLHSVYPRVYAVGHPLVSWRGKLMAGVLFGGQGAVVSHLPAAALLDLLPGASPVVHITVPRRSGRSRPSLHLHQTRGLSPSECTHVDGIPVTGVERTLSDIAGFVRRDRLEQAVEQAVRMSRLDFAKLAPLRGKPGAAALRAVIAQFDPLAPETNLGAERLFLRVIRKYRLPQPQANVAVGPYVVDFLWPQQRLIVELDSLQHHRRPSVFEADRKRDIDLKRRFDHHVLRVTHRRLEEEPAVVAQEIAYFLSACGP